MTPSKADLQAWQRVVGATPDGAPGPATFEATVAWLRMRGYIDGAPPIVSPMRARVVAEARVCIGDWAEPMVDGLWLEVGCPELIGHWHDKAWCGGFALRCLRRGLGVQWTWKNGRGFLERVSGLRKVSLPEPGDIGYLAANAHHFVVERCEKGRVYGIDGNHLPAPREGVAPSDRAITDVTTFYSIAAFV